MNVESCEVDLSLELDRSEVGRYVWSTKPSRERRKRDAMFEVEIEIEIQLPGGSRAGFGGEFIRLRLHARPVQHLGFLCLFVTSVVTSGRTEDALYSHA